MARQEEFTLLEQVVQMLGENAEVISSLNSAPAINGNFRLLREH
jgi:hypothetical protein